MLEKIAGLKPIPIVLTDGVDQTRPVTMLEQSRFLQMHNFRLSLDMVRVEKRDGLAEVVTASTLGAKDVFGYTTYYNADAAFCQLAITEEAVWRKIASGSWTSIHTWSETLTHPVKVQDIQGKKIIITEFENIMILPSGTKVQLGITAPTTIPTVAIAYDATLLNEDMAVITDWSDGDAGSGASSQATFDSKSTMRLLNTGSSGDAAIRYRTVSDIGPEFTVEFSVYFNTLGTDDETDEFILDVHNGRINLRVKIDKNDLYIYSGAYWVSAGMIIKQDKWLNFKIYCNSRDLENEGEYCEVYLEKVAYGHYVCSNKSTSDAGKVQLALYGSASATDAYVDSIKIGSTDGGKLNGVYRYAVTYRRSGDYPNDSNPIRSIVGTASQTGSGLNDLTAGGTYTSDEDRTIRVQIDGTGTPDTIKVSYDGGDTWHSTTIPLTDVMYLNYGVELTWEDDTGHTDGDYWDIECDAFTANPCHQKVSLSSIPLSSDAQVDQRRIWRTMPGGTLYYLLYTINDNTTTTFTDNLHDNALATATLLEYDHDVAPNGRYTAWFDNKLWIADDEENILYYSKTNVPDAFDTSAYWVSARRGELDDEVTGIIEFKSYLFVFKRNSISYVRKKDTAAFGIYDACKDYGLIAPWSLLEVNNLLMFLSFRGWELFNGCTSTEFRFSLPVKPTLDLQERAYLELVTSGKLRSRDEVWLSLPDRTGGNSAITIVCQTSRPAFYTFSFHKTPSCMWEARDSSKQVQLYVGTRDGYVFTCDSGSQDGSTNISAWIRSGWANLGLYTTMRRLDIEYELPATYTLLADFYVNFDKDTLGQRSLAGATPTSATDRSIRLPIEAYLDLFAKCRYFAYKLSNAEAIGSDLKITWLMLFAEGKQKGHRLGISGD